MPHDDQTTTSSALERASRPLIDAINRVPQWVPIVAVFVLVVAGGLVPWGWVLMAVAILFLLWLLLLSWPRLTGSERLMRIAVLTFLVAITVAKALPH